MQIVKPHTEHRYLHSFPTRRSSDLLGLRRHDRRDRVRDRRLRGIDHPVEVDGRPLSAFGCDGLLVSTPTGSTAYARSEEHTSELQSRPHLVCRLLLEKKKIISQTSL